MNATYTCTCTQLRQWCTVYSVQADVKKLQCIQALCNKICVRQCNIKRKQARTINRLKRLRDTLHVHVHLHVRVQ